MDSIGNTGLIWVLQWGCIVNRWKVMHGSVLRIYSGWVLLEARAYVSLDGVIEGSPGGGNDANGLL